MTEQEEAASAHMHAIVVGQWLASRNDPTDAIHDLVGDELSGVAEVVRARLMKEFETVSMRFCSHLIRRPVQPVFLRSWLMTRAMCEICLPSKTISAPADHPCDYCQQRAGHPGSGKKLNMQTWQSGMIAIYFGLCTPCTDTMLSELAPHRAAIDLTGYGDIPGRPF